MPGNYPHELPLGPFPAFAATDAEAEELFAHTRHVDPFPDIPPALLNTADVVDYIAATGMLHPFTIDPTKPRDILKPASCGLRLHGEVLYFEGDPPRDAKKVKRIIEPREELVLEPNSITYVGLEPTLRLPDYIAARFNLTIREIYRGILVGTGPLVDPGFVGQIFLPLHNLTCNEYILTGGEPVAWMEFTKISPSRAWKETYDPHGRCAPYVSFPDRKRKLTLEQYIARASSKPIRSSISTSIEQAQRSAETSQRSAEASKDAVGRTQTRITFASFIALVTVGVALLAIYLQVVSTVHDANSENSSLTRQVGHLEREVALLTANQRRKPARSGP